MENKKLLIVKGFDYKKFLLNQDKNNWMIVDIREVKAKRKKFLKSRFENCVFGCGDLNEKSLLYFIKLLFLFIKSKDKYLIDNKGKKEKFSFLKFIFWDTPLFTGELIFNLLLVIFSLIALFIFNLLPKRKSKRLLRHSVSDNDMEDFTRNDDLKKIIYLRTDNFRGLQQGGSFTHFRGVVKGFDKLGYEIHYIGSGGIEVPNLDFLQSIIPYPEKFNFPEIPEIYYNWRFIPKAYKIIKNQKSLFLYQRHSIFNICGVTLSYLTKIPLILEYNGSEYWVRQKWGGLLIFKRLCYFMEKISLRKAHLISVVSEPIKNELLKQGIPGDKILVNYNGVDPQKFNLNIDGSKMRKKLRLENKIIVGTLSTFGVWHGTKVFSKAVKSIIKKYPIPNTQHPIHFLFIGDGVERPECEKIIQEYGMEKYVTFTGTVPFTEIQQYLAACDILVASHIPNPDGTPFFGSPTKLFEYMAMGKGIVASDLDQIGEVLEHKETAWLVKPGEVDDLVNGIIELIQNENLRKELGRNACEKVVKNYTWEQNAKRVIDAYDNLLKDGEIINNAI